VETSQPAIDAAGHELMLDIPDEPIVLHADPVRLAQIFANLISNAAKYTPKAGQVWCTARCENGIVVVTVRDSGVGIPADMLPRVFDMFTQVDSSHHRSHSGLGIGLTLVQSLVQMHDGTVSAFSEGLGKGSEFVVRLPLASMLPTETAAPKRAPAALAPVRVMVVDDNYDAADSLGMLVECLGAEVHVVHDGPAALNALETFNPALVLLDIGMPGMDGYEVARRIRQQPRFQDLTLIALTGWGQDEDRRRSHAAGIDYHLIKPPDIDTLQALMASVAISEHKLPRQQNQS
jgi:CheY-like chemotaxis protein